MVSPTGERPAVDVAAGCRAGASRLIRADLEREAAGVPEGGRYDVALPRTSLPGAAPDVARSRAQSVHDALIGDATDRLLNAANRDVARVMADVAPVVTVACAP